MTDSKETVTIGADGARQSGFVRRMIDSHSVLGLAFAVLIYVVSISGAFSLFVAEISLWENPDISASYETNAEAIGNAASAAEKRLQPGNEILNVVIYAPSEFQPYMTARLNEKVVETDEFISTDWVTDPQTGKLLDKIEAPLAHNIEQLHTLLHLPRPWGRYLVGLLGVVMFTLILSGIFAHPSIFRDAFKLRLDRNARVAWTDMHNRLSVWGLPFHLVLTFTGAFLGVAGITVAALAFLVFDGDQEAAIQTLQGPQAIADAPAMAQSPDYAAMVRNSAAPDRTFSLLIGSNPQDSGDTTNIAYYEDGLLAGRTTDIYRNSGEYLETIGGSGSPVGARIFSAVQPLHYGTFGGYPIKIIYFIMALALTYITSTGMMIWFKRKMQQGQPKPKHQAAWHGMTTGLSIALAACTLIAATGTALPQVPSLLAIWAMSGLAIFYSPSLKIAMRYGYLAVAIMLAAAALIHLPSALAASEAARNMLIITDISLIAMAAIFGWLGLRGTTAEVATEAAPLPAE